jgi:hypothetical protein
MKKDNTKAMEVLALATGLALDDAGDKVLYYDDDSILVYAHLMTENQYHEMEGEINNFSIKGKGFEVYAWNDNSGFEYWREEGKVGDCNYIQVSAAIKDPEAVDPEELKSAVEDAVDEMSAWSNTQEYWNRPAKEKFSI